MRFNRPEQALNADLYWAVSSPDMMQLPAGVVNSDLHSIAEANHLVLLKEWITGKDHSQALQQLIEKRQPTRLGIYYETLWQYVLENFPGFQLIARNLPIRHQGKTLGELDFIYYCQHRKRYVHLETAVKYYLGLAKPLFAIDSEQPALSWSQWLGPGSKDRLDLKLLKMLNHQTQLSDQTTCQDALQELGVNQPLKEICLKGYFFYPLDSQTPAPHFSHASHNRGHWLPINQLDMLSSQGDCWQIMAKEQWLSPLSNHESQPLLTAKELEVPLKQQLADKVFPIMIASMKALETGYQERARFFITPNHWPVS